MTQMKIFDPCCGSKMFWFQKDNVNTIYGDIRKEDHILCDGRYLKIDPDILMDYKNIPFPDDTFKLVVFDPPHLKNIGDNSWMKKKYGRLNVRWQDEITKGFFECFRVLKEDGILVFKWNEHQIKIKDVLCLTEKIPLFGNTSGKNNFTHWYIFMK